MVFLFENTAEMTKLSNAKELRVFLYIIELRRNQVFL